MTAISYSPWRRFFARGFDNTIFVLIPFYGARLLIPHLHLYFEVSIFGSSHDLTFWLFLAISLFIVEPIFYSTLGATPGKLFFGISLQGRNILKLSFLQCLKRNILLCTFGLVFQIPVLSLIGYLYGYISLEDDGVTLWDKWTEIKVSVIDLNSSRKIFLSLICISYFSVNIIPNYQKLLNPMYRVINNFQKILHRTSLPRWVNPVNNRTIYFPEDWSVQESTSRQGGHIEGSFSNGEVRLHYLYMKVEEEYEDRVFFENFIKVWKRGVEKNTGKILSNDIHLISEKPPIYCFLSDKDGDDLDIQVYSWRDNNSKNFWILYSLSLNKQEEEKVETAALKIITEITNSWQN